MEGKKGRILEGKKRVDVGCFIKSRRKEAEGMKADMRTLNG